MEKREEKEREEREKERERERERKTETMGFSHHLGGTLFKTWQGVNRPEAMDAWHAWSSSPFDDAPD